MTTPVLPIIRNINSLRQQVVTWRQLNQRIALVPTMGALHEGHLQLIKRGFEVADKVVTTIFVNPKQFAAHEDLGRYPRDEEGDVKKLFSVGTSAVFTPPPEEIYPPGFATSVHMEGPAKAGLEDHFRPDFFDGVATIVAKLFIQSAADFAIFGEKDYQQLKVVKRMARDLDLPIEIIGVPTKREADGLAMSSRNAYLSAQERSDATAIIRALQQAAQDIRGGAAPERATQVATEALTTQGFKVDYVAARNAETLAAPQNTGEPLRLLAAAWLGKTRLIDNIAV